MISPFDVVRMAKDSSGSAWLMDALHCMDATGLHYIRDCIAAHINRCAKHVHASHVVVALVQRMPNEMCELLPIISLIQHESGSVVLQWILCLADDAHIQPVLDDLRSNFKHLAVRHTARSVLTMMSYRVDISTLIDTHLSQLIFNRNGALLIRDLLIAGTCGVFECILRQPVKTLLAWSNDKSAYVVIQASLQECCNGSLMVHKMAPHHKGFVSESGLRVKRTFFATASPCAMQKLVHGIVKTS